MTARTTRTNRRYHLTAAVAIVIALLSAIGPNAQAAQGPDPSIFDVIARFDGATDVDWAPCPDGETPLSFVDDRLIGVGLSNPELIAVEGLLGADHVSTTYHPYGVVSFELAPQSDPIALRNLVIAGGVDVHLNHVFFFNPFWRFHPYKQPSAVSDAGPIKPLGQSNRPVVVFDTGYPTDAKAPEGYALGLDSYARVDDRSMTTDHGPFIASQVSLWAPGNVTLQRVMVEKGFVADAAPEVEEHFDEISLIETMDSIGLTNAVVNFSFGTYGCEQDHRPAALEAAIAFESTKRGATFVTAAGNDESGARHYPSAFVSEHDAVIAVGAHDGRPLKSRTPDRACFSNFGDISQWAPGMSMVGQLPTADGSVWAEGSGTSFAAPFVAAVLASGPDRSDERLGLFDWVRDGDGARSADVETACG